MFILDIIPLAKIPLPQSQILSYYSSRQAAVGSLVLIPLRKKEVAGLVIKSTPLKSRKLEIKKADYEIKSILRIISEKPIVSQPQIDLALWLTAHYWTPLGAVLNKMLTKSIIDSPPAEEPTAKSVENEQTLILVPRLAHIQSILDNLKMERPEHIATIHRQLTEKRRLAEWSKIRSGQAKFIIGTSVAIFSPFANLKQIIVEEGESSHHKSTQHHPRLDARLAAVKLAQITGASATIKARFPTTALAEIVGRHPQIVNLQITPFETNEHLSTTLVDMNQEFKEGNFSIFSRLTRETIKKYLAQKQSIILFNNRRGTATLVLCQDCGHIIKCQSCDSPLVYHLATSQKTFSNLLCHHCHHQEKPPGLCPNCQGHRLKFSGTGTEKVEMELKKIFPRAKIARLDGDTDKKERQKIIDQFIQRETNILIGTQAIFSPDLNLASQKAALVGIISLDTLLHLPDFNSSEKIFYKIRQLANLADQELIIQTHSPDNETICYAVANDLSTFLEQEKEIRQVFHYPPFYRLIKLTYKHHQKFQAEKEAKLMAEQLKRFVVRQKQEDNYEISDPQPAFVSPQRSKYIWNIVIKATQNNIVEGNKLLKLVPPSWLVNVDPENLL